MTLGDRISLEVVGEGTVDLEMPLTDGSNRGCALQKVLYVPKLAYNLVSVSKATEAGKTVQFNCSGYKLLNKNHKAITFAERRGSPFHLKVGRKLGERIKGRTKRTCGTVDSDI